MDKVSNILRSQLSTNLRLIYNKYPQKNGQLSLSTVQQFVINVLKQQSKQQVDYVMNNLHRLDKDGNKTVSFEELANFLHLHCAEISLQIRHRGEKMIKGNQRKMNAQEFEILCNDSCAFLKVQVPTNVAKAMFAEADQDRDGWITYEEYFKLVRKYFFQPKENPEDPEPKPKPKPDNRIIDVTEQDEIDDEWDFIITLWTRLKQYFDKFDKGSKSYLTQYQLKNFVMQVFPETLKDETNNIFWNKFKVDINGNKVVEFEEFAPFIFYHAAEIGLHKFHRYQSQSKNELTLNELFTVFTNAFGFLTNMQKHRKAITQIHRKFEKGGIMSYTAYYGWIIINLSRKIR